MKRKIMGAMLIAGGLAISAAPAAMADDGTHREVVCHATGNGGYVAIPPDQHSAHIPKHEDDGDFLLKATYNPEVDGKWSKVKDGFNKACNDSVVVTPPPSTVTVTKPPKTVTETVRPPKVTVTVTAPAETTTVTAPAVTETVTTTPTVTVTTPGPATTVGTTEPGPIVTATITQPATTQTVAVPGKTIEVRKQLPNTEVTKTVAGKVVTSFVERESGKVVATETTDTELAYTGINLVYLFAGIILVLLGVIALMGVKLTPVKK